MCPCVSWTSLIFDNIQQIKKVDSSTNRQNVRRTQEEGCSQDKPAAHPTYKEMVGTAIKELSDPRVTQLLRGADAQR